MPVWERTYVVNEGPLPVCVPGSEITLTAAKEGTIDVFKVTGKGLDPCWNNSWFVPRGDKEELPWMEKQLPEWAANDQYLYIYDKRLVSALRYANANTLRLEGEITVNGKKELVLLFIAQNACSLPNGSKRDILVIRSVMESLLDLTLDQDGTGHGNPR